MKLACICSAGEEVGEGDEEVVVMGVDSHQTFMATRPSASEFIELCRVLPPNHDVSWWCLDSVLPHLCRLWLNSGST